MTHYKMIDAATLSNFRRFMASGIPLTEFGPQGAFDAKPRRARDADPEAVARGISAMLLGLKDQLGTEAFRELCDRVCDGDEPEEAAEDDEVTGGDPSEQFETPMQREMSDKPTGDKRRAKDKKAKDSPPDFKGEPETKAMDSATDPRFAFVADMQRLKPGIGAAYTDRSSQARRAPSTASGERSFGEMFGQHALNIKGAR